jgi:PEP-CTERM motif
MKKIRTNITVIAASLAFCVVPAIASAQTIIGFGSLGGAHQSQFVGPYVESGFQIVPTFGTICVLQSGGNPGPALGGGTFCAQGGAEITITRVGGGLFNFLGADVAHGNAGSGSVSYRGRLLGSNVTVIGQSLTGTNTAFDTYDNSPIVDLDELVIRISHPFSYTIDNLQLAEIDSPTTTVPEPSTVILLAIGVLGIAFVRRRRA